MEEFTTMKDLLKDALVALIYPIVAFYVVRNKNKQDKMDEELQEQRIKFAVVQTKVETLDDDIREIKDSIDKLPERIKSDIKDILNNGKN